MTFLLSVNLAMTSAMFGVIWMVQLVHYPMFEAIARDEFQRWHGFHSTRITYIVGPLMTGELAAAGFLVYALNDLGSYGVLALTIGTWLSTAVLSVPIHNSLGSDGAQDVLLRKLVRTNWPRTILYSLKMVLLLSVN